jgi:hypothetical protein
MGKRPNFFEIVREPKFEKNFRTIAGNYDRADDIESNIDWALSRDPYFFPQINNSPYHIWKTGDLGRNFPQMVIIYRIDHAHSRVILIDVM